MKNIIFLTVLVFVFGCKNHKDEVSPESKSANLHIEFTATSTNSMWMTLKLNVHNKVSWSKLLGPSTSFSLVKDTVMQGGQGVQFVSSYSSSTLTNTHIKITYNNIVYCDDDFADNGSSISKSIALPFIP